MYWVKFVLPYTYTQHQVQTPVELELFFIDFLTS